MYVNPFWLGAACTLLAEFGLFLLYAVIEILRKRKK